MNIITGYTGTPHITSLQDRAGHQGAYGTGSYVLNVGNKLAATAASANEIRVADGCISHQGCLAIIEPGTYDSVEIANGTQGMNRNDLIVARYTKNAETNVESMALVVIQGEPTSGTAADPSYTSGNIQSGATTADMPLYRVALSGVTIDSVTALFSTVRTQAEADALLGDTSISGIGGGTVTGAISSINSSLSNIHDSYFTLSTGSGTTSIASGTVTNITSKTLEAGIWLLVGMIGFNSNGSGGYRGVYLANTATGNNYARVQSEGVQTGQTTVIASTVIQLAEQTTVYMNAIQGSGSACNIANAVNRFRGIRLA